MGIRRPQRDTPPPGWPQDHDRPRVLVEAWDGALRWAEEGFLEREGFEVRSCAGPEGLGAARCPLAVGDGCALAEGADVIYNQLGLRPKTHRDVAVALRAQFPNTPIVLEVSIDEAKREAELLDAFHVETGATTGRGVVEGVKRALEATP